MIHPIRELTLRQFELLLLEHQRQHSNPPVGQPKARAITSVHLHHTWRPNHAQWRGLASVEAMRRFHMDERGFSDIAQHLTIAPDGGLWTGRDWNQPPASAKGTYKAADIAPETGLKIGDAFNGHRKGGPFMIEMVGDFDEGRDRLAGAQLAAVKAVIARLTHLFAPANTALADFLFSHRRFTTGKTCCGTQLIKESNTAATGNQVRGAFEQDFLQQLEAAVHAHAQTGTPPDAGPGLSDGLRQRARAGADASAADGGDWDLLEVPETTHVGEQIERYTRRALGRDGARDGSADWHELKPYLINCEHGHFSDDGDYEQTAEAFEAIFAEHIPSYIDRCGTTCIPRLMIHAHGGLVGETSALKYAKQHWKWWRNDLQVYPLFFVWETGLFDTIADALGLDAAPRDARGWFSNWTDRQLDRLARVNRWAWETMKTNAWRCCAPRLDDGRRGVAHLAAERLVALQKRFANRQLEIHLVGHSAGSIFHAHFLQALDAARQSLQLQQKPAVRSVAFLAPALTNDLLKSHVRPVVDDAKAVGSFELYTMDDDRELSDTCMRVYRKSLLYWVSRGFDANYDSAGKVQYEPIFGLQTAIRADASLSDRSANGWLHGGGRVQVWWSSASNPHPRRTDADTHGGFDNDPATMNSVAVRILGLSEQIPATYPSAREALARPYPFLPDRAVAAPRRDAAERAGSLASPAQAGPGRRRALCVGINAYADAPLDGCVNDSRRWAQCLQSLEFQVEQLHDREAGRGQIVERLTALIATGRAGDVLVFQFAGHGTWLDDLDGDEADRRDEALVPVDHLENGYLLDDDLARICAGVAPGVRLYLFMDCCHSGSNSRFRAAPDGDAHGRRKVRYLPPNAAMQAAHRHARAQIRSAAGPALKGTPWVHCAACQDDEYAYEDDGQGDFTRAATERLVASVRAGQSPRAFMQAIATELGRRGRQRPLLLATDADYLDAGLLSAGNERSAADAVTPAASAAVVTADVRAHLDALYRLLGHAPPSG